MYLSFPILNFPTPDLFLMITWCTLLKVPQKYNQVSVFRHNWCNHRPSLIRKSKVNLLILFLPFDYPFYLSYLILNFFQKTNRLIASLRNSHSFGMWYEQMMNWKIWLSMTSLKDIEGKATDKIDGLSEGDYRMSFEELKFTVEKMVAWSHQELSLTSCMAPNKFLPRVNLDKCFRQ